MFRYVAVGVGFLLIAGGWLWWAAPAPTSASADTVLRLTSEQQEDIALVVQASGHLCAKVVDAKQRGAQKYYIECETKTDSLERRAYDVDMNSRKAR